jgi:glucan phosphoethanolaminetransferase (alkaline phosphatase superfamily)
MVAAAGGSTAQAEGIPYPIVTFNRWVLVVGILGALALRQPAITTLLFLVLTAAVAFGPRYSLIFQVGRRLFGSRLATAEREDRRLMRFNNMIAALILGLAQVAFLAGASAVG